MKAGVLIGAIMWGAMLALFTGCAGTELYSKVGWRRVDEQQEQQRTFRQETLPLICYFKDCRNGGEANGS